MFLSVLPLTPARFSGCSLILGSVLGSTVRIVSTFSGCINSKLSNTTKMYGVYRLAGTVDEVFKESSNTDTAQQQTPFSSTAGFLKGVLYLSFLALRWGDSVTWKVPCYDSFFSLITGGL